MKTEEEICLKYLQSHYSLPDNDYQYPSCYVEVRDSKRMIDEWEAFLAGFDTGFKMGQMKPTPIGENMYAVTIPAEGKVGR